MRKVSKFTFSFFFVTYTRFLVANIAMMMMPFVEAQAVGSPIYTYIWGYGIDSYDPPNNVPTGDPMSQPSFDAIWAQSPNRILYRKCFDCAASHQDIYYRRIRTEIALPFDMLTMMLQDWFNSPSNVLNTDFELYSTYEDAVLRTNKWNSCNYNDQDVGFPRDCGPTGSVGNQWNSFDRHTGNTKFNTSLGKSSVYFAVVVGQASVGGDPHFVTFGGMAYSYHGECDLVLMKNPSFASGQGLDIHIRTTRIHYNENIRYSYISAAALRIGEHVLEVSDFGAIIINGVEPDSLAGDEDSSRVNFAGSFDVHKHYMKKLKLIVVYDINLHDHRSIRIRVNTRTGIIFVDVKGAFEGTMGLLGATGADRDKVKMLARDGETDLTGQWNAFGEEWQVRPQQEIQLFAENRSPQYPVGCIYKSRKKKPNASRAVGKIHHLRRGLMDAENTREVIDVELANKVCAHASYKMKQFCIDDVMATGDIELAMDSFYISII